MTTILMLPDDLLFNCLSRVSRLYYPTLSLVSKRFCSLLASKELYQTRTLLDCTESCLYVCFWLHSDSSPLRCFTLGRRPYRSKKVLVPISSPNCQPTPNKSNFVVVGSNIYALGGLIHLGDNKSTASSRVMVMDCYSHKWRDAPSMRVPRAGHTSCVLDGKLYVTGGCENLDSTNWMEVFDTKTQTWEFFKIPSEDLCKGSEYKSAGYEGTLYVRSREKDATYKLNKGRWRAADLAMNYGWGRTSSYCVIENVFCRYGSRRIDWYDSVNRVWTALKDLELFPKVASIAKLTAYGGKLMILWQENGCEKRVWCSEIAIEKRQNGEIWGTLKSGLTSCSHPMSHIV